MQGAINANFELKFEIVGVRCLTCQQTDFAHVITENDIQEFQKAHVDHEMEMDTVATAPTHYIGKRVALHIKEIHAQ